jgi:hypothetical protein
VWGEIENLHWDRSHIEYLFWFQCLFFCYSHLFRKICPWCKFVLWRGKEPVASNNYNFYAVIPSILYIIFFFYNYNLNTLILHWLNLKKNIFLIYRIRGSTILFFAFCGLQNLFGALMGYVSIEKLLCYYKAHISWKSRLIVIYKQYPHFSPLRGAFYIEEM